MESTRVGGCNGASTVFATELTSKPDVWPSKVRCSSRGRSSAAFSRQDDTEGSVQCHSVTNCLELGQTSQVKGICPTRLPSLQTPTPSSGVPRPPTLLTNWLHVWRFPLLPQVPEFTKRTHRTQVSTVLRLTILP